MESTRILARPHAHDPGPPPRRWPRVLLSTGVVLLVLLLVLAACAVTVYNRVDRLTAALDATTDSADSLFDTLLTDPAAADADLTRVRDSLDDAQEEFAAFPMPQLEWVPGLRDDMDAASRTLAVADSLVDDVAPTLISVATVVDLETGSLRNPADTGWRSTFDSVGDIATQGADALDSLCTAADTLEAIDLSSVMDPVARPIGDLSASIREACDSASEYGPVLGALDSGGELLDGFVERIRDAVDGALSRRPG